MPSKSTQALSIFFRYFIVEDRAPPSLNFDISVLEQATQGYLN